MEKQVQTISEDIETPVQTDPEALRERIAELERQYAEAVKTNEELDKKRVHLEKAKTRLEKTQAKLEEKVATLQHQLDYWLKKIFGRMSEKKHLPLDPNQLSLFSDEELAQMTPEEKKELEAEAEKKEEYVEKTIKVRKNPKPRDIDLSNLPVNETHIYPEGTTDEEGNLKDEYEEIGTEVSKRIEKIPASVYVNCIIRHKVIAKGDKDKFPEERKILTPALPQAPIERGMAGASLLADIILAKFMYHMPFYRQINQFREYGLRLPPATVNDWYEASVESLHKLYRLLKEKVLASEYIQIDESVVPVIDNEKHRTRKGYQWCVRDGLSGALFFWYSQGSRSKKTARELLGGYTGTFQSDGYPVYDDFCAMPGIAGAACWAHVRRKFVDALKEDRTLATQAIVMIGKLYQVESDADEAGMKADQRKTLRQKKAYPVIRLFEKWCLDNFPKVLPKSLMGQAISYAYSLMERLSVYVNDGRVNIDNNLIENAIRPLALGRKNWLFCANDASAYRAAIVYSMIASCKAADVDPRQWMEHVLVEIPARTKAGQQLDDLLPAAYAMRPGIKRWNLPDPD